MVDLSVVVGKNRIGKRIKDIEENQIPFALSGAMRETVQSAQRKAVRGARRKFDNPTEIVKKQKGGMIRFQFDSKKDIQKSGVDKANAKVFILDGLVNEMHSQVFGGITTGVPEGSVGTITPTRAVIKGLAGKGRLRHLNQYGNIANLWRGAALKTAKKRTEFVNVPLFGKPKAVKHMHSGLYIRVFKDTNKPYTKAHSKARERKRARRGGYKRDSFGRFAKDGGRETILIMLIAYETSRRYKRKFKYDQIVLREYSRTFRVSYARKLAKAIRTAKPR